MSLITLLALICLSLYASGLSAQETSANDGAVSPAQSQWLDEKHKGDFDSRVASIEALLSALRSAALETGDGDRIDVIETDLAKRLTEARQQYDGGDYVAGRGTLDQAYDKVTAALIALRGNSSAPTPANADEPPASRNDQATARRDYEQRAEVIDALVLALNGAARETGDTARVSAITDRVAQALEEAKKHYDSGESAAGRDILEQTYAMVQAALVEVRGGETLVNARGAGEQYQVKAGQPKAQLDYRDRADSIDVLMAAYQRVAEEKGDSGRAARVQDHVAAIVARADGHYQAGDYDTALPLMTDAYTLVKESLAALRDGETLVRSLNFASKEEEYQYYLTKTDSQMTALRILKQHGDSTSAARLDDLLATARSKLDQAGALAAENRHAEAVPIMDNVLTRLQSALMMFFSAR